VTQQGEWDVESGERFIPEVVFLLLAHSRTHPLTRPMIPHLLVATKNKGKVAEFRELLSGSSVARVDDLTAMDHEAPDVDEIGHTFRDNACLKATAYAQHYNRWALADDSGLAVDALGGKPGIHSARWAQLHNRGKGDADNNALLLEQLNGTPDAQRTARFMCVLALANPQGQIVLTAMDAVEGRMLRAPRGQNGFGYDPLFFVDSHGKTTAELTSDQKHAISHRGKAMRHMVRLMRENKLIG
jgi:XTP/dITP diphosphohydrolase